MTTYYVNGVKVKKEDLHKYEITNKHAKREFLNAITKMGGKKK